MHKFKFKFIALTTIIQKIKKVDACGFFKQLGWSVDLALMLRVSVDLKTKYRQ